MSLQFNLKRMVKFINALRHQYFCFLSSQKLGLPLGFLIAYYYLAPCEMSLEFKSCFKEIVASIFNRWTALKLAVEHGMAGQNGLQVICCFHPCAYVLITFLQNILDCNRAHRLCHRMLCNESKGRRGQPNRIVRRYYGSGIRHNLR